ncbi:3-phosphoshikimate 1-carboxyvinyltransferase [Verrucomicrobiota bacterium]
MSVCQRRIEPCEAVRGVTRVPGDKSMSHRAAMVSALCSGKSTITGFLQSEDCLCTLSAVEALGAGVSREGDRIVIVGTGGAFTAPSGVLDLGNSGTGMRLLAGLLAGQGFTAEMTGDSSLLSRPMTRIKDPLEMMGAKVDLLGGNGCGPVRVSGGTLQGIEYAPPAASAQVKSCVLFAGMFARGETTVIEKKPTRDHTELMLRRLGIEVRIDGLRVSLGGPDHGGAPDLPALDWDVPGDFSSAAFCLTAAACRPGSDVRIENVGINPRRTAFLDVLRRMGADIEVSAEDSEGGGWEPVGTIRVRGAELAATDVGGLEIPNMIDELPLVAVAAAAAEGVTTICDAAELRVKESDRIAAVASALSVLGVDVKERPDGMVITGRRHFDGGVSVESLGDHRIAMAMAVAGLFADSPVMINGTACTETSYPGFWDDLSRLTG